MKLRTRTHPLANAVHSALQLPGAPGMAPVPQNGFSLLEVVVTMGVVALLSAGVYTIFKPADSLAQVQVQGRYLGQLKANVNSAFPSGFAGISPTTGKTDGWLPNGLQTAGSWGAVNVVPITKFKTDDSWSASFPTVPAAACQKVVLNQLANWDKVTVDESPVTDVQSAIEACSDQSPTHVVAFTHYGPLHSADLAKMGDIKCFAYPVGHRPGYCPPLAPGIIPPVTGTPMPVTPPPGTPVPSTPTPSGYPGGLPAPTPVPSPGAPPIAPPPGSPGSPPVYPTCSAPAPQTQTLSCPTGQIGAVTQSRSASCPSPVNPAVWGPWSTTSNTCAPECQLPTPSTQTQAISCPNGQISSVAPYGANGINQVRVATCPAGSSSPVWGSWSTTSNLCAPACVVPPAETQVLTCPSGQLSSVSPYSTTGIVQKRTASCPSPTGAVSWGSWSTTSNTCVNQCVLPAPSLANHVCSDWNAQYSDGRQYSGSGYTLRSDPSCATPVSPVTWGAAYMSVFNCTISNTCKVPSPSTVNRQPSYYAGGCPGGMSLSPGQSSATWRTYTVQTYSCPKTYGPAALSAPTWDGTGGTYYSGCAPTCVAPSATSVTQTQVYSGSTSCRYGGYTYWDQNQQRTATTTYVCPAPTGAYTSSISYSAWVNVGVHYNIDSETCDNCVSVEAYVYCRRDGVEQDMRAGDVRPNDELLLINPENGAKRWGRVSYSSTQKTSMVRLHTAQGVTLRCSKSAPIGLFDGTNVLAAEAMGCEVVVEVAQVYGADTIVEVEDLGLGEVQLITCENDFFLAGDEIGRYLAHHNKKVGHCVSIEAYVWARRAGVEQELKAGDVQVNDELQAVDPHTGAKRWARVSKSELHESPAVTFVTEGGVSLTCSVTAPIALADGYPVLSVDLADCDIQVEDQGARRNDRVVSVKETGFIKIQRIMCGEVFFQAGDQSGRYVLHHD